MKKTNIKTIVQNSTMTKKITEASIDMAEAKFFES